MARQPALLAARARGFAALGRRLQQSPDLNAQLSAPEIFKNYEKADSLQARAEEIETLLLEKLERWEMLEAKQNVG